MKLITLRQIEERMDRFGTAALTPEEVRGVIAVATVALWNIPTPSDFLRDTLALYREAMTTRTGRERDAAVQRGGGSHGHRDRGGAVVSTTQAPIWLNLTRAEPRNRHEAPDDEEEQQ
jgi:hypothetical protein